MHHFSSFLLQIFCAATLKQRLGRTSNRLTIGFGVVVAAALISVVQTEPARDANDEAPRSHPSGAADIPSANDLSPFGYLVFDWTGQLPGFSPIDAGSAPTQRTER